MRWNFLSAPTSRYTPLLLKFLFASHGFKPKINNINFIKCIINIVEIIINNINIYIDFINISIIIGIEM